MLCRELLIVTYTECPDLYEEIERKNTSPYHPPESHGKVTDVFRTGDCKNEADETEPKRSHPPGTAELARDGIELLLAPALYDKRGNNHSQTKQEHDLHLQIVVPDNRRTRPEEIREKRHRFRL